MKKVLGLALHETTVGGYDTAGFQGQINVGAAKGSHDGLRLLELEKAADKLLSKNKYEAVAIPRAMYSINVTSFEEADKMARMIGVVLLVTCRHKVRCLVLDPCEISSLATGRRNATLPQMQAAALHNGVAIKTECVALAYWIMVLGQNKLGN